MGQAVKAVYSSSVKINKNQITRMNLLKRFKGIISNIDSRMRTIYTWIEIKAWSEIFRQVNTNDTQRQDGKVAETL